MRTDKEVQFVYDLSALSTISEEHGPVARTFKAPTHPGSHSWSKIWVRNLTQHLFPQAKGCGTISLKAPELC